MRSTTEARLRLVRDVRALEPENQRLMAHIRSLPEFRSRAEMRALWEPSFPAPERRDTPFVTLAEVREAQGWVSRVDASSARRARTSMRDRVRSLGLAIAARLSARPGAGSHTQ